MKIKIVSDLHLEFGNINIPFDGEDYLILAGDIQVGMSRLKWFQELLVHRNVIYVMGNHEYYNHDFIELKAELLWFEESLYKLPRDLNKHSFSVLQDRAIYLNLNTPFIKVIGCTLWTSMYDKDSPIYNTALIAQQQMNDYHSITHGNRILTPLDTITEHESSVKFLEKELNDKTIHISKTIVITHHAPSIRSVHKKYKGQPLNLCYYSPLDHLVELADVWIHGHTHTSFDYTIGKCKVICNPRGYKNYEENPQFNPNLVIDV